MRLLCCVLAAIAILSRSSQGAWLPDGTPVCSIDSPQSSPAAISDGADGVLVVWVDGRNGNPDLFAQRLTPLGSPAPGWPAAGLAVCTEPSGQGSPLIATDGAGGVVIAWWEIRTGLPEIYMLRITGDGAVAPGWTPGGIRVIENSTYCPLGFLMVEMVADGTGGASICCSRYFTTPSHDCPGSGSHIVTRHITGEGLQNWEQLFYQYGYIYGPRAAPDGSGGVFIAWRYPPVSPVYATHVTRDGQIGGGWPTQATSGSVTTDQVVGDGFGGAFFHFLMWNNDNQNQPWLQHLGPDGTIVSGWSPDGLPARPASFDAGLGVVIADGAGGAMLCWPDRRGADFDLYAQRMTRNGALVAGWPEAGAPVCVAPGDPGFPSIAPDGLGGAWLAWDDPRNGAPAVHALRLSGSGTPSPGWPPNGQKISPSPAGSPGLAVSDPNTAFVVWADSRPPGSSRVYAQRLLSDGPVPVLLTLTVAEVTSNLVRLVGHVADPAGSEVSVDRRGYGSGWIELASISIDGAGRVSYSDRTVLPGQRLSYRLRVVGADGETWSDEVSLAVPETPGFALHSIRPIPSGPRIAVAFSLPDAGPAVLEVLDTGGRRVFEREVGSLGPGEHVFEVASPLPAPGVYLVRLTRGAQSVVIRACSLR